MQPFPAFVGIDIGADAIHVATSYDARDKPTVIALTNADWFEQLSAIVHVGCVVALEPTGWHYSAPIVAALQQIGAPVLRVEHRITGKVRELRISGSKRDMTDAQALCYIATHQARDQFRGVRPASPDLDNKVTALRLLIWSHVRANKEHVRTQNRIRQLAHSIWPALDHHLNIYLRAVKHGAATPHELRVLVADLQGIDARSGQAQKYPTGYTHATARKNLYSLVESLPVWLDAEAFGPVIRRESIALADQEYRAQEVADLIRRELEKEPFADVAALWLTVPCSSHLTVASMIAATHAQAHEMNRAQFKACVGSHPTISQSGETSESAMARQGFPPAKSGLYLWTMQLIKAKDNPVAEAFEHRKARGQKYAIQEARGKLCLILHGIAKNGQPYSVQP